ncbi:fumarylacetoacetate hydrolase family protein [Rhizorhabdus histidinilytica]|uniref:2,4-diketo-3-deoxy-L-fuconate hydrolase n=1 Tax=Rhizorhabdus histidinilytica TaxID=439228 RepID=A0A1T5EK52_9SPHN|nr:fumarylacetoacetate hydrolase family protein [Rhizorhabdus histidinilytica]QEH76787.1 fumarylacetoacetate hydrolase family protein [Sphingomonas sp. C8-2]SKB84118.1 2,4-diketo-3-deoxy-L-fuconate hydrolase [Rhizorhabdus histidinilytica]
MKFVRFGPPGRERPGCIDAEGRLRSLASYLPDISREYLDPDRLSRLKSIDPRELPIVTSSERLGPCLADVGKLVCVGLNYADHAEEAGMTAPAEPILFMKPTSSIAGPDDDLRLPRGATKGDWEVELGVVIGLGGKYIEEAEAMAHVAGYCMVNDISERCYQLEGTGQWLKGKSADGFGPIGPWLVTADEIADPHALTMRLDVNGWRAQDGTSGSMIFRIPFLISYISRFMSLAPGDIIATGTPAGVGMGQKPPVYLKPGDVMELEIEGLGRQRQRVLAWDGAGAGA